MFSENLKTLRKDKGFSQEQLSLRLNVVRQTISKWEKGLSVPDAEMLVKISEVLDVSVSDLLGKAIVTEQESNSLETIALELEKLNEILVVRHNETARFKKTITAAIAIVFLVIFIAAVYGQWNHMFYELGQNVYHWFH